MKCVLLQLPSSASTAHVKPLLWAARQLLQLLRALRPGVPRPTLTQLFVPLARLTVGMECVSRQQSLGCAHLSLAVLLTILTAVLTDIVLTELLARPVLPRPLIAFLEPNVARMACAELNAHCSMGARSLNL